MRADGPLLDGAWAAMAFTLSPRRGEGKGEGPKGAAVFEYVEKKSDGGPMGHQETAGGSFLWRGATDPLRDVTEARRIRKVLGA